MYITKHALHDVFRPVPPFRKRPFSYDMGVNHGSNAHRASRRQLFALKSHYILCTAITKYNRPHLMSIFSPQT
jgi:hypothetical protein